MDQLQEEENLNLAEVDNTVKQHIVEQHTDEGHRLADVRGALGSMYIKGNKLSSLPYSNELSMHSKNGAPTVSCRCVPLVKRLSDLFLALRISSFQTSRSCACANQLGLMYLYM